MAVVAEVGVQLNSRNAVARLRALETATAKSTKAFNLMGAAVKAIPFIGLADATRRFFQGFAEADKARAAVKSLGVDADALSKKLLGVSSELNGLVGQTELTAAAYDVASAGFTDAADAAEVLEASAKGAIGGLSDLNTVADATTSVLNAYGLSSEKAGKLVDGFIQTQNDGKIVVAQYAAQIGRVAPIAAAAGVGIEDLNAAISTVTATGVPVESTFAGLRQAIASVIKPTDEAKKTSAALGLEFSSAAIKAKGFGGFLSDVVQKTGGSEVALTKLFGSVEAVATVLPLANDGLVSFNENLENQKNAAGAADAATALLGGTVTSQLQAIVNDVGTLARQLDTALGPAFKRILERIKGVTGEMVRFLALLAEAPSTFSIFQANLSGVFGAQSQGIDNLRTAVEQLNSANISTEEEAKVLEAQAKRVRSALDNLTRNTSSQQLENRGLVESISEVALGLDDLRDKIAAVRNQGFDETSGNVQQTVVNPLQAQVDALLAQLEAAKKGGTTTQQKTPQQEQLEAAEKLSASLTRQTELAKALTSEERAAIQLKLDKLDIDKEFAALTPAQRDALKEQLDTLFAQKNVTAELLNQADKRKKKEDELAAAQEAAAQKLQAIYDRIGSSIASGVVDTLSAAVDQTKSLADAAANTLRNIANILLQLGVNTALKGTGLGIFSNLQGFANGGRPPVGRPSIVGERGPELFVPSTSGTIVPSGQFGGGATNVVVNVDAKGTSASGDNGSAKQLGGLIGAAVQAELVKQQRPGGLLAR